ncbi:MAG: carboxypeptidase-like regulatory domain-containing protein [Flavihumibacter sp.]|nr:carboxypeptidase-like regulatory domain-containing protein [Flavihumibacter sp.]
MNVFNVKKGLILLFIVQAIVAIGCSKSKEPAASPGTPSNSAIEKGVVKGRVTDSKGNGIANVKLVIEHTIYYGTYVFATTDQHGYYKTTVPNGSWQVTGQIERALDFAGSNGAIRNFSWKLKGAKPGNGYYGSSLAVYAEPGSSVDLSNLELTLAPVGLLIDGNPGPVITGTPVDIVGGEEGIKDIPIAKYRVSAKIKNTNEIVQIRLRNIGNYGTSVEGVFKSGFTGNTQYQLAVEVK